MFFTDIINPTLNENCLQSPVLYPQVMAGCVFSILFPLFIVSGNQASIVSSPGVPALTVFNPTIAISNAIFSRTIQSSRSTASPYS